MIEVFGTVDDLRSAIALTLMHCIREGRGEELRPLLMRALVELDQVKVELDLPAEEAPRPESGYSCWALRPGRHRHG